MVMVTVKTPVAVDIVQCNMNVKVRDEFACNLVDSNGNNIMSYDGYVPGFFPGNHYGDYLILNIDINTGQILNWVKPTPLVLSQFIEDNS